MPPEQIAPPPFPRIDPPVIRDTSPVIRFKVEVAKMLEQIANAADRLARNGAWITWKRQVGVLPVDVNKTRAAFYAGWDAHRTHVKPKETP